MDEYRFTFGVQYAHEPHPNCEWAHPDGWLTVIAPTRRMAIEIAAAVVGRVDGPNSPVAYSFDYGPDEWSRATWGGQPGVVYYTRGELARVTVEVH